MAVMVSQKNAISMQATIHFSAVGLIGVSQVVVRLSNICKRKTIACIVDNIEKNNTTNG